MIETQESITAKLCSFARAYHSNTGRKKIFDDYLAYDMMGKEEYEEIGQLIQNDFELREPDNNFNFDSKLISSRLNRYIAPIPLSRIAFIRIFELDHPDTGRYKLERIHTLEWNIPGNLKFVPIDFSKDDMVKVLLDSGFDPTLPSFFAILGVSYYLTLPVFEQTVSKIGELCKAQGKIVFDYPDETTLKAENTERVHTLADITEKLGERMMHGYSCLEIHTVLERYGFNIEEHETPQMIQQHYFENRDDDIFAFENIHFVLADRRAE